MPRFSKTHAYEFVTHFVNAARRAAIGTGLLLVLCVGPPATADGPFTILAFGDSLTAGYGLLPGEAFPDQLETALRGQGHDVRVINSGVSGDTTAGGRRRLAWALSDNPDAVIIELGANDGLRGFDPAETYSNLDAIITEVRAQGLPVLLTGMKALPNLGVDFGSEFESIFPRLADEHDIPLYPFFLDGVAADLALNQADAIHPTADGIAVIVERILPEVVKLIDD